MHTFSPLHPGRRARRRVIILCTLASLALAGLLASCGEDARQSQNPLTAERSVTPDVDRFQSLIRAGQQGLPQPAVSDSKPMTSARLSPALLQPPASPTIDPDRLDLLLLPGQCTSITKRVYLPGERIARADILFAVDLTGSMGDELAALKAGIPNIAAQLATIIDDPAFGLISYMDYPAGFDFCGYASTYGGPPDDQPYILNQPIDTNVSLTQTAVAGLALGWGADGPESYARALYETYADPAVAWRAGARRIVVNFGDNIPHDCDIGACVSMALGSTGVDPGRDATAGTADDLAILDVMNGMAAANTTLIHINSAGAGDPLVQSLWQCWAAMTGPGGVSVVINPDGTVPGGIDLAQLIFERVGTVAQTCASVTLVPSPGFESWVVNLSPASYVNVELPATLEFTLDICVPPGTIPDVYNFQVCATCGDETVVCEEDRVTVRRAFFTGGGWIEADGGKGTFGFNAGLKCDADEISGHLQYNDHVLKGKLHVTSVDFFNLVSEECCNFGGTCKFNKQPGFTYVVRACDYGEPGRDDVFGIVVRDPDGDVVYTASGKLMGGNIQMHDCPTELPEAQSAGD